MSNGNYCCRMFPSANKDEIEIVFKRTDIGLAGGQRESSPGRLEHGTKLSRCTFMHILMEAIKSDGGKKNLLLVANKLLNRTFSATIRTIAFCSPVNPSSTNISCMFDFVAAVAVCF